LNLSNLCPKYCWPFFPGHGVQSRHCELG